MKVEREYMSMMNSTVSHEMRNPLNAIVSHSERQERQLNALTSIMSTIELTEDTESKLEDVITDFKRSLRISRSSTKLIRFNVEDILALPQLKSGKFTKNIAINDLRSSVIDIVDLMEFQSKSKDIKVQPRFEGFPPDLKKDDKLVLPFDQQRFQ